MRKTLEVKEIGGGFLYKGGDYLLSRIKRNMKFMTSNGRYRVVSIEKTKYHRKILVSKIKGAVTPNEV